MNDVAANKILSIRRCVERARAEYGADPASFATNVSAQDAATMNVLRACELAIDLANHTIRTKKLGIPSSSSQSFELLFSNSLIDARLCERLKKMTHFRNLVIHDYQASNVAIVESVITSGLDDLLAFSDQIQGMLAG